MNSASHTQHKLERNLKRRYRAERRFRLYGMCAVAISLSFLLALLVEVFSTGLGAFRQTYIQLPIDFAPDTLQIRDPRLSQQLMLGNYQGAIREALVNTLDGVDSRRDRRDAGALISVGASFHLQDMLTQNPELLGQKKSIWLLADDQVDSFFKSRLDSTPIRGRLKDQQLEWLNALEQQGLIKTRFNVKFFTSGDSAEPEQAGIFGALVGSFFAMVVTLILSFPIGVATAIYLEEYAKPTAFTRFLELNINNLAAVPSVIYGLLGLAIFINFFELPRSVPLVAGLVLTLMTLPTIIISSRASIRAVQPSIREAALGMGASKMQLIMHHILPIALPGMLTGAIIGMAQALGETAPLLMIGMVAFIVDVPTSVSDPSTVLPVQIFLWADSPDQSFVERTSAAIIVLLAFLMLMNATAIVLRKKLSRRP